MAQTRVAIDGFNLALPNGTGVATYGFQLADALAGIGFRVDGLFGVPVGKRPDLREVLFFEAMARGIPPLNATLEWLGSFRRRPVLEVPETGLVERRPFAERLPRFDRLFSSARLFGKADRHFARTRRFLEISMPDPPEVMHWTYPVPIRLRGARNLYTLHDLVPLKLPYATLDRKRLYHRLVERCVAEADHLVTVSESSRQDVIRQFGCAPDRITNTYQSAPALPAGAVGGAGGGGAPAVFGLRRGEYFLYYGAIEPKKNVGRLLEAYLASGVPTPLVLVGARAWQAERDLQLIEAAAAATRRGPKRVIRLEYLPRSLLLQLVADARAVLFPSLYEGFGLPVLEAMQLGTPVVTSDTSSLPEVAGDAAMLVDPYDTHALARAIARVDADADLRAVLSTAGRERAALFSPARYRQALEALYGDVLARSPRNRHG